MAKLSLPFLAIACCAFALAASTPVALELDAPGAHSVCVAGSFDSTWQECRPMRRVGERWSITLDLQPGRYELAFRVDGEWRASALLPVARDGFGGVNNVLTVVGR